MNIFHPLILNCQQMQGLNRMTPLFISFNPQSFSHRVVDRCRQCRELDNQARARDDFTLYRSMLKTIRHTEEGYKDNSHVIFLLQVNYSVLLQIGDV